MNIVYNMDCMEGMKDYPDNYFDLAIVDPPYGAGLASEGGCQGWFAKYREDNKELGTHFHYRGRSKRFKDMREQPKISRGGVPRETLQSRFTDREQTPSATGSGSSRNGTATKKLSRGMLRLNRIISMNCSASHVIRSYGGEITSIFRLPDAS